MLKYVATAVTALGLSMSASAFANHHDGEPAAVQNAQTVATEAEHLAELAGQSYGPFTAAAMNLHIAAEGFAAALDADSHGMRSHHGTASFAEVETAFWRLAHAWNADALRLSQDLPVKAVYLHISDDYTRLLFSVD